MEMKVIDVSKYQGNIDWATVKGHIDGAIIRCGVGSDIRSQDDVRFKENVEGCIKHGIPFGVYLYSYAKSVAGARSEALHVLRLLAPYKDKISFPVYYDLEESGTERGAVERALVFGEMIEAEGYWCGIYANQYWWQQFLKDGLDRYTKWVAKYSTAKPVGISGTYDMWQYSSKGSVPGINGNVDMNICYRDLPGEIKGTVTAPEPAKKSYEEIAEEVLQGKWGIGVERKNRLTEAGYDYASVQAIVNEQLQDDDEVKYHTVQKGEVLSEIATQYDTTHQALAKLNGIKNPNIIYVGQKIRIK